MYRKLRKQIIMRRINLKALALLTLTMAFALTAAAAPRGAKHKAATRWSEDKANAWYAQLPWMSGCNYTPATAINQIEMWSKDTYDPVQIDKELGWAEELGFNTMRVFLSSVVYKNDPSGLKKRINNFLDICSRHGIRPLFVFFDDCWAVDSHYGKQPAPKTGVHNSGWVQDPPVPLRADTVKLYKELGKYVKDIVSTFRNDKRILMWDLYNEPGNRGHLAASLPLLKKAFEWARSANPSQPLTSAIYTLDKEFGRHLLPQLQTAPRPRGRDTLPAGLQPPARMLRVYGAPKWQHLRHHHAPAQGEQGRGHQLGLRLRQDQHDLRLGEADARRQRTESMVPRHLPPGQDAL